MCCPFGETVSKIAEVCDRKGWSLAYFFSLEPAEREFWIAWEYEQERKVKRLREQILERAGKDSDDGTPHTENISARALLALLGLV